MVIAFQKIVNGDAPMARRQLDCIAPTVQADGRNIVFRQLHRLAIVGGAEAATCAFSVVLKANTPIGALDSPSVWPDAHGPEQVKFPLLFLANFYAILRVHDVPDYGKVCQESSDKTSIITIVYATLCQSVPSYAKADKT